MSEWWSQWLKEHRMTATIIAIGAVILNWLPQWLASVWSLFSSEPMFPWLSHHVPFHFSSLFVTVPISAAVILAISWGIWRPSKSNFAAVTFDDAIILPSDRHDGTQVLRHNGAASQVIKDSAPDNTDQNVTQWIEARFPTRVVLTDDRYHFGFEVQIPQSHLRVMIRRMKNRPEYI